MTPATDQKTAPPEAAVIIPHFNDQVRLGRCLSALMPQVDQQTAGRVEVVVIDNGSDASPDGLVAAHPNVRLVVEDQKGAAHSRNRGVAETSAPLLFFLDCDCVPEPDWLTSAFAVAGRADLVGGEISVFDETPPPRSGPEAFETVFAFKNRAYIEEKGFSVTANLLTRRDVFEATGGFRHGLSEDLEWCQRATSKGFGLVHAPELRVAHPTRADWAALEKKWLRVTRESWGLKRATPVNRALWALRALAMPLTVLVHAPAVLRAPRLAGMAERGRALATLGAIRMRRCFWMLAQACGREV